MFKKIIAITMALTISLGNPITAIAAQPASVEASSDSSSASVAASSETEESAAESSSEEIEDAAAFGSSEEAEDASALSSSVVTDDSASESSSEEDEDAAAFGSSEENTDAATDSSSEETEDAAAFGSSEETEDALLVGSGGAYDGFELGLMDAYGENPVLKLCYLSDEEGKEKAVTIFFTKNGESTSIRNKADLANAFGIEEEDIPADVFTFKVFYKDGNNEIEAEENNCPVLARFGEEEYNNLTLYLKKFEMPGNTQFYFRISLNYEGKVPAGKMQITIPIEYDPTIYCTTKEEAYQMVRDIIWARTNNMAHYYGARNYQNYDTDGYVYERIYVKEGVFTTGSINVEDFCDFAAEREGMNAYEGDYMYNLFGNRIKRTFFWLSPSILTENDEAMGWTTFRGEGYDIYEIYLPVITTREEEQKVDEKVAQLMNSTFAGVKDGTNNQKIKAVYDYVTKNVSGTVSGAGGSDRTYPLYHTAYHALIKGNGTCEAFAQLFTRLTRELGVPSKVIMGVDANNHTYNIVEADDGFWYFIDCSAKIYLSDSKHFSRAQEQERFTSPDFIINYWNKIKGGTSYKADTIKAISGGEIKYESTDAETLCSYIKEDMATDTESEWIIRFDCDMTLTLKCLEFGSRADRVSIDLNGHTIRCKNSCFFEVGRVYNGKIQVGYKDKIATHSGDAGFESDVELTNVDFTGVSGYDRVHFVLSGAKNFVLNDVSFAKCHVLVAEPANDGMTEHDFDDYDYNFTINGTVTLDGGYFFMLNREGKDHPVIIAKTFDESGNVVSQGKLVIKNSPVFGEKLYSKKTVMPAIEFATSGNGRFANGDVLATRAGLVQRIKNSSGATEKVKFDAVVNLEASLSHTAPEDLMALYEEGGNPTELVFAKAVFTLFKSEPTQEDPDNYTEIDRYVRWTDIVDSIDKTINDKDASYRVLVTDDADVRGALKLPKKLKKLTICSDADKTFKFTGKTTTLTTNVAFENLKVNIATNDAAIALGAYGLALKDASVTTSNGDLKQITGGKTSTLEVIGDRDRVRLGVKGNITAGNLTLKNADLISAGGAFSVSALCSLSGGSAVDAATNVTLANLSSGDEGNSISFGTKKGTFKINGRNDSPVSADVTATDAAGASFKVQRNAISVTPKFLAGDYSSDKSLKTDIVTAPKFPASFFVIDRGGVAEDGKVSVAAGLKKVKKAMRINGQFEDLAADLYLYDGETETENLYGSFATLKEALAEITALADSRSRYIVRIDPAKADTVTNLKTNISTPKTAKEIRITTDQNDENAKAKLYLNNNITLGSNLTLENLVIADNRNAKGANTKINISLGAYELKLVNVQTGDITNAGGTDDLRFGKVTGNGVGKTSALRLERSGYFYESFDPQYMFLTVGDITGVGALGLNGNGISASGKINVGNIAQTGDSAYILTFATVKTDRNGQFNHVTTGLSAAGTITKEEGKALRISVEGKPVKGQDAVDYRLISRERTVDTAAPIFASGKPDFEVIKAPRASSDGFDLDMADSIAGNYSLIKKGGIFYLVTASYKNSVGLYNLKDNKTDSDLGDFLSFNDVVNQINSIGDKNGAYTILVYAEKEGAERAAEKLTMPKAGAAGSLMIMGEEGSEAPALRYIQKASTIAFNCYTYFGYLKLLSEDGKHPLSLNLGKNVVSFYDVQFDNIPADYSITYPMEFTQDKLQHTSAIAKVTGSGIGKGSQLNIMPVGEGINSLCILGDVSKVDTLYLFTDAITTKLAVLGKTNVGNLVMSEGSVFYGSAALTPDKSGKNVTAVNSNITVTKAVKSTVPGLGTASQKPAHIALLYGSKKNYSPVFIYDEAAELNYDMALDQKKFQLLKTGALSAEAALAMEQSVVFVGGSDEGAPGYLTGYKNKALYVEGR